MRVVVPALHEDNVAARCLRAERVTHEVRVLDDGQAYARLLAELWVAGDAFTIIEDDIAPFPGSVAALARCPYHWCGHYYCLPGRWDVESDDEHEALMGTNGFFKVSAEVMRSEPDLYQRWVTHNWQLVDVAFNAALRHVFGLEGGPVENTFHVHNPPVAHAMHYRPEVRHGRSQVSTQAQVV